MNNRILFVVANICSSFSSLFIVLFIIKEVSQLSGKENLFQALGMAFYLGGMAVGSYFNKNESPSFYRLFAFEFGNFLTGSISLALMFLHLGLFTSLRLDAPTTPQDIYQIPLYIWGLGAVLLVGFFTGGELPEFLKFSKIEKGKILFFNYLGALFSGVFLNFLLGESYTSIQILFVFAVLSGLTHLALLIISRNILGLFLLCLIPTVCIPLFPLHKRLEKTFLATYYFGVKADGIKGFLQIPLLAKKMGKIENVKTPYQDLHLVTEYPPKNSLSKGNISLFLNYRPQFDIYSSRTYHESMYYGGVNLLGKTPENILILGGGDGILLSVIKKSGFKGKVTLVELDPKMIELFSGKQNLLHFNNGVLVQKEFTLEVNDGFQFLKDSSESFEAIFIDFPYPYSDQLTGLYSEEFYSVLKHRLKPNGFAMIDFPLTSGLALSQLYSKLESTLQISGFKTIFPFGPYSGFVFTQLKEKSVDFNYQNLPEGLQLSTELNLFGLSYLKKELGTPFSLFYEN